MPRRKRNHRRHGRNKKKRQNANRKNQVSSRPNNTTNTDSSMATCSSDAHDNSRTLVNSDFMTPKVNRFRKDSFEMETPVRKFQPEEEKDDLYNQTNDLLKNNDTFNYTPLVATPVNKRRSLNRHKDGTLNVTNLNVLFDSNVATPVREASLNNKSINEDRPSRSLSSIPKLHSPDKEKPLSFNKSTQTMDEELIMPDITETPKISQKTHDMSNKTHTSYSKNFYNQKMNEIQLNPYLKDKEIVNIKSQWQKDSSVEELSFFSPQLYEMKSSSTPIQGQVVNYLKENDTKIALLHKKLDGTHNRDILSKTPRSAKLLDQVLNNSIDLTIMDSVPSRLDNVNLNTPPLTEKVIDKDKSNSIRLMGSSKKKNRISPKINRLVNHSRVFTKNLSRSRVSVSRRLSLEHSCEVRSPPAGLGVYEKMVNKIKRYSKASAKWSGRMMESCAQLGIQIKNSLSSLCDLYNDKSMLESSQSQNPCHCDSMKKEIGDLNVKIDYLTVEVGQLRRQIQENHNDSQGSGDNNNYQILNEDLNKVRQELITFKDLRSELTTLKEQFQSFKNTGPPTATSVTKPPAGPPALAPPPPPPPPPPPMPLIQVVPPKLNLQRKSKSTIGMSSADNSRPVISLDDILKVKLKKTSERPASTPNRRQRTISTPMGSTGDLFRQIKLRSGKPNFTNNPAINQTSSSTPGASNSTMTPDLTTSPANSLNKFLEGTSVWRVKRLKKVGAYSFDNSVHRRLPMVASSPASRRERPGN